MKLPCGLTVDEVRQITAHMRPETQGVRERDSHPPRYHYGEDCKAVCQKMADRRVEAFIAASAIRSVPRAQIGAALGVSHEAVAKRIRIMKKRESAGKPFGVKYHERFQRAEIRLSCRGASLVRSLCY